jgi:hypothetical protein
MVQRYWLAAIVLVITPWASQAPCKDATVERSSPVAIANSIPFPPYMEPGRIDSPCAPGEDDRLSDLCAQWKAADAGRHAADWTQYGVWVSLAALGAALLAAIFTFRAIQQGKISLDEARRNTALAHPPRFKITRCLVCKSKDDFSLPDFEPNEPIFAFLFALNCGRYDAAVDLWSCTLHWEQGDRLPMSFFFDYFDERNRRNWIAPKDEENFTTIEPGSHRHWELNSTVPAKFKRGRKWSHSLYLTGFIRYRGAAQEARGLYFCKRYSPATRLFEDVPEHENED